MPWGGAEYSKEAQALVDEFNASHPNIQVTYRLVPWTDWFATYNTAVSSNTAPDLSTGAAFQSAYFYEQGAILPIDDVIADLTASGDANDFIPGAIDTLKIDGHYMALPWNTDVRLWSCRKDLLDAAGIAFPTTWNELRSAARTLTKDGRYGIVVAGGDLNSATQFLVSMLINNGGGLFNADRQPDATSSQNLETATFISDLVKDGSVHPGSIGFSNDDFYGALSKSEAACAIWGPGLAGVVQDVGDKIVALQPLTSLGGDKGTIRWINNVMIYKQTQHPDEAKTFLKWWSQHELPIWTIGHSPVIPARSSFLKDPYFDSMRAAVEPWLNVGKSFGSQAPSVFAKLNAVEGSGAVQQALQKLLQGDNPAGVLTELQNQLQQLK